ncbi:hypothetical protein AAG906_040699 [Vitis piasezkii]
MINTISFDDEDFEINKDLLRKDFYFEANKEKKDWFFSTVSKDIRTLYQEEFYFWIWFELFKQEEYPYYHCKRINNTSTKAKIWQTSDNIVIESIHPPEAKIEKNINGTIVKASPLRLSQRIKELLVEEIIETQDHIKNSFVKNDNKPLFKPFEFSKKFQENPHIDQPFIDRISQKVKDSLVIPKIPQPFVILETPLPSHRRINLVKRNISSETKVNGLIKTDHCNSQPKTINILSQEQKLVLDTLTIKDLQEEIRQYKKEIKDLRQPTSLESFTLHDQINRVGIYHSNPNQKDFEEVLQVNNEEINACLNTIIIKNKFIFDIIALIDSGVALNCLQEGLIPIKFYEKTEQTLFGANGKRLAIRYKLSNAHICNQDICIKQTFILVKDLKEKTLLRTPFLSTIYLMWIDDHGIRTKLLEKGILFKFANPPGERNINTLRDQMIQAKENHVNILKQEINLDKIVRDVCFNLPNVFWHKKQHEVELPYEPNFIELERGTPRLVINYKPLNDVLRWIRYPIPNKKDLLRRLVKSKVFSKFDMKSRFWQIQVKTLPCLALANPKAFKIVETDASDIGYGGILKQKDDSNQERLVRIHKSMAPKKKKKQPLRPIKKSTASMKPHSALSEKFMPLYYEHFDVTGSCSFSNDPIPSSTLKHPSSPNKGKGNNSDSLPFDSCRALERKLELVDFPKAHPDVLKHQAPFSPLGNGENKQFTPLVNEEKLSDEEWSFLNIRMYFHKKQFFYSLKQDDVRLLIYEKAKALTEEKQVFISTYLQDLHIYISVIPGLRVLGLKLVKDMEFDNFKICRSLSEPLLHQQDSKQFCNCNRNFTISRVCIDLQYYQPISLAFKNEVLTLTPELLLDYGLVHQLVCSDPSQASNFGRKINLGLIQGFKMNKKFNRKPTLLSCPLEQPDICIISRDFEAYPKNMGYLIAADSLYQIFCNKKIDPLPTKSTIEDMQLLMEHHSNYILP